MHLEQFSCASKRQKLFLNHHAVYSIVLPQNFRQIKQTAKIVSQRFIACHEDRMQSLGCLWRYFT